MGLTNLIPAAAALLCLEVALVFAILYVKVTRRKEDLLFSLLALALAVTRSGSFLRRAVVDLDGGLFWLRLEAAADFIALVLLLHFVSVAANEPLRRPWLIACYAAGAALALLAWSDDFYRITEAMRAEAASVSEAMRAQAARLMADSDGIHRIMDAMRADPTLFVGADMEPNARGPMWLILAPAGGMCGVAAIARLSFAARRHQGSALAPLAHHLRLFVVGGLAVVLTMGLCLVLQTAVVSVGRISIQSIAVVLLCVLMSIALGREIVRGEAEKHRLEQLAQFRAQAVRDVAHELKNPLAAIQMAAQTVRESVERGVEPAVQCELLEMCVDACRRLNRLINNMLDTARMEAGRKVELRAEETDILALIRSILALQGNTTSKHALRLETEVDPLVALVDGDKLHQIVTNLVSNAIKYSPAGGDVVVRLSREGDEIRLGVTDEGIGMTPEQLARLFQPFERVVDPDRKITGTGIGLHLVKRLVEAHGGRIRVESQPGKGSTFALSVRAQGHG